MNKGRLEFDMVDLTKYLANERPENEHSVGYDCCVWALMNYFEDKLQLKVVK